MALVCCPMEKKVESKVWRRYHWTFTNKENSWPGQKMWYMPLLAQQKKIRVEIERYSSKRRKWWFTRSSLKEIVNFVFNKSTQETRRIWLSRLIPHKKEIPRKSTNPKNRLKKTLT